VRVTLDREHEAPPESLTIAEQPAPVDLYLFNELISKVDAAPKDA
jgi:hypothetical protein